MDFITTQQENVKHCIHMYPNSTFEKQSP